MRVLRRRATGDEGSLALALLATLIIMSFTTVVATTTLVQQRVTRVEKQSSIALQAADAGLQDARYRVINRLVQPSDMVGSPAATPAVTGTVGGVPFSWTASYSAMTLNWRVVSTGGTAPVRRKVAATLVQGARFDVALFTNNGIGFAGGNSANSYKSGANGSTYLLCTAPGTPSGCSWNTGQGIVASNANVEFGGNNTVDGVAIYDWAANPGPQRCPLQNAGVTYCQGTYRTNTAARLPLDAQLADMNSVLAACPGGVRPTWKSSANITGQTATFNFAGGGTYCFQQLIFDATTVLPASATPATPLKIYVKDFLQIGKQGGGGAEINCAGCGANTPPTGNGALPQSAALLISTPVSTYAGGSGVAIYSQTKVAAGIYAPNGSCGSPGSSNSQVDIYGSLLCSDLTNQGGWAFHFDDRLKTSAGNGLYDISDWNESPS